MRGWRLTILLIAAGALWSCASPSNYSADRDVLDYQAAVSERFSRHSRPALGQRAEGRLIFRLLPNGGVTDVGIAQSSGYPDLDDAAVRILREISPFPEPPARLRRPEGVVVVAPFRFEPHAPVNEREA
jgi:TonB family protein